MKAPELFREVSLDGRFRIATPADSTHEVIEDGTGIAFYLRKDCEALYLKRYELPRWRWSLQSALKAEARRFLKEGVLSVRKDIIGSNIECGEVNGAVYAQLLVSISEGQWWIARLVAIRGSQFYYLLHCHGPKDYMVIATAMFCEFYVVV